MISSCRSTLERRRASPASSSKVLAQRRQLIPLDREHRSHGEHWYLTRNSSGHGMVCLRMMSRGLRAGVRSSLTTCA